MYGYPYFKFKYIYLWNFTLGGPIDEVYRGLNNKWKYF